MDLAIIFRVSTPRPIGPAAWALIKFVRAFRTKFPQLDSAVDDREIADARELAVSMTGISDDQDLRLLHATAHCALAERIDQEGASTSVQIGSVQRQMIPVGRSARTAYWSGSHFGRTYLTLVRSRKKVGVVG